MQQAEGGRSFLVIRNLFGVLAAMPSPYGTAVGLDHRSAPFVTVGLAASGLRYLK
jgi:hypothetical protein